MKTRRCAAPAVKWLSCYPLSVVNVDGGLDDLFITNHNGPGSSHVLSLPGENPYGVHPSKHHTFIQWVLLVHVTFYL